MDQVELYVKPVKDFAKDSMRLVKRCTKPDLKGERLYICRQEGLMSVTSSVCCHCRVSAYRSGHGHWVRRDGIHWLLRETHPHPNQQYHCVSDP